MELDDVMRDCLMAAYANYPDLDIAEIVIQAFGDYVAIIGYPVEIVDEVEGEEYFMKCVSFLIDCMIFNMIEQGIVEFGGIEDGEMVYTVTAEF